MADRSDDLTLAFECPRSWESLDRTADASVRHCGTCDRPVHLSRDAREAAANGRAGRCVALAARPVSRRRRARDWLARVVRVLIHGRSPRPLHAIPDPAPPPPPRSMKVGMLFVEPATEIPVLGWLVRLDGPSRGQLIPCGPPPAEAVIDDPVTGAHLCRVTTSAAGFVLRTDDPDGVVVNGRRVQVHDLVDGDRLELDAARYVFKSVL